MPKPSGTPALPEEMRAHLKRHPDTAVIEALMADVNGVLRGKRLPAEALERLCDDGLCLPASTLILDIWGTEVADSGLVFETGDADRICRPVSGTLRPVPWLDTPTAQVLLSMTERDGAPFYGDPRQVLASVLARFEALDLTPVVATELEFRLFDAVADGDGRPQPPLDPNSGQRLAASQLYGLEELHALDRVFTEINAAARNQGLPTDTLIAEQGVGQYEINLHHVPDALAAADHAVLLKRAIKGVAARHGMTASFMAKPFGDQSGNGLHAHFSLLDRDGRNVFAAEGESESPWLRHAIGGLIDAMADSMAVFAPHANSYRRFQLGSHAPMAPAWGHDNRTTALRIPLAKDDAARIEHRVSGADANPYLALALILAGAHQGITRRIEPPPETVGDAYAQHAASLPDAWGAAIERFERSAFVGEYLGEGYRHLFSACKRQEREVLRRQVPPAEYAAYLRTV